MATLFLIVGLPGAGKTTLATKLAAEQNALLLTPDAWMIPLFGESNPSGKRDVLEGRLLWLAFAALRVGTNVVLDFGFWSRDERSSLQWLAAGQGSACRVIYLPVDRATQLERVQHRWRNARHETFAMTEADVDTWRGQFEPPDAAELAGEGAPEPPAGSTSWDQWAAARWPSFRI